jgi:hypothetical protein
LAVYLHTRDALILLTKNKITSSLYIPFKIIYYSLHPAKTLRYFSDDTKKLSLNQVKVFLNGSNTASALYMYLNVINHLQS